jgi:hypothetical protein
MELEMKKTTPVGIGLAEFRVTRLVTGRPNEFVPVKVETNGAVVPGDKVTGTTVGNPFGPVLVDDMTKGV